MASLRKFPNDGGFRVETASPAGAPVFCPVAPGPDEALYAAQVLHRKLRLPPPDFGQGLSAERRAVLEAAVERLIVDKQLSG
jgi:hypothetical protein